MRLARSTTAVALALVLLTPAIPAAAAPASVPARPVQSRASARKAVPGRLIVKFKGAITADKLGRVYRSADTSAGAVRALRGDVLLWKTPRGKSDSQFAKALSASGEIEYAVPDYIRQPAGYVPPTYVAPNDPDYNEATAYTESKDLYAYGRSWWLREMNAASAWSTGYTGSPVTGKYPLRAAPASITVGVLDTGTWMTHPDLQANVVAGWDFFDHEDASFNLIQDGNVTPTSPASFTLDPAFTSDPDRVDYTSHGTCVTGEIASTANNSAGSVGVGYQGKVVSYKISGLFNDGTVGIPDEAVIAAIQRAADDGCKVINMSFGGYEYSAAMQDAVNYAHGKGCVLVAAKGNDSTSTPFYPAADAHVLAVGALAKNAAGTTVPAWYSNNFSTGSEIMAPGSMVWSLTMPDYDYDGAGTVFKPGYSWWDGTSMATPATAGALALLWRAAPALTNDEITQALIASAPLRSATASYPAGYRTLDMAATYTSLKGTYALLGNPVVNVPAVTTSQSVPASWAPVPGTARSATYDVSLDGTPVATGTVSTSMVLANVPFGTHSLKVIPHSRYNWEDGTASSTVTFKVRPTTEMPLLESYAFSDGVLSWRDNELGWPHTHTISIDGGAPVTTSAEQLALPGLALGHHTGTMRITDTVDSLSADFALDFGAYGTSAFTEPALGIGSLATPLVGTPVSIETTLTDHVGAPMAGQAVVLLESSDGSTFTTSTVPVSDLGAGRYRAAAEPSARTWYRFGWAGSGYITGAQSGSLEIAPRLAGTQWQQSAIEGRGAGVVITSLAQPVVLVGRLVDETGTAVPGASVALQASADGANYSDVAGAPVYEAGAGWYRTVVSAQWKTYFRLASRPTTTQAGAASAAVVIYPRALASTPSVKSTVYAYKRFTISGTLLPRHPAGGRLVQLRVYRLKGSRWVKYATYWASSYDRTTYTRYALGLKLRSGTYRVSAYAPADAGHAAYGSGYRKFRVR